LKEVPSVMNRGFFNESLRLFRNEADLHVKTLTLGGGGAILSRKGTADDYDYMNLGDYGKKFGDGENGVIMRGVYRQVGHSPSLGAYQRHLDFLHMPVASLRIHWRFRQPRDDEVWRAQLARDVGFGLNIHPALLTVEAVAQAGRVTVTVSPRGASDTYGSNDFRFHRKKGWAKASGYFGRNTPLMPLTAVALAALEKAKMTRSIGDESDLWTGPATRGAMQDSLQVEVILPPGGDCSPASNAPAARIFNRVALRCTVGKQTAADTAPRQSMLGAMHAMHANERLAVEPFSLVEVGSGKPEMWPQVLPTARTARLMQEEHDDYDDSDGEGYDETFAAPQIDQAFMKTVVASAGPIDFVTDDNGNPSEVQLAGFRGLLPSLRPGATYAIQDIESSYNRDGEVDGATINAMRAIKHPHPAIRAVQFSRNNVVVTKKGVWRAGAIGSYGTHGTKGRSSDDWREDEGEDGSDEEDDGNNGPRDGL